MIQPGTYDSLTALKHVEAALANGTLEFETTSGKWYRARRNGRTKRWKRDATRWEIPVKVGFRTTFRFNDNSTGWRINA